MKRRLLLMGLAAVAGSAGAQGAEALPPFDSVEISGSADVRFTQGEPARVQVDGDDDARRRIDIDVSGRTLHIRTRGDWRFWSAQRLQLQVTAPQLARLQISGAGSLQAGGPLQAQRLTLSVSGAGQVRLDQLQVDVLRFAASGAGEAVLGGRARDLAIEISGRGDVRAENLQVQRARVAISGLGDVSLWATDELTIGVSGVGRVDYWGTPQQVRRATSGAATITPRGPKAPAP